jgi:hypothetical protein
VKKVAAAVGVDVCFASAVSTTWALSMHYARPDGTVRTREFSFDIDFLKKFVEVREGKKITSEESDFGIAQVKDSRGRVLGMDMVPKIMIGPDSTVLKPDQFGKEELNGDPLIGEPPGLVIADDERLLKLLVSIGVPTGNSFNRWYCSIPDMTLKQYEQIDIFKSCLAMTKRDPEVAAALELNAGENDRVHSIYGSGPMMREGSTLKDAKKGRFSRLRR